jgi:hypothetical protein
LFPKRGDGCWMIPWEALPLNKYPPTKAGLSQKRKFRGFID